MIKEIPRIIDTCTTVHKICEIRFYVARSIFNMVCQPVPLLNFISSFTQVLGSWRRDK